MRWELINLNRPIYIDIYITSLNTNQLLRLYYINIFKYVYQIIYNRYK